jgi:MoaA/NifB/PqqE/SkfB family radical SAM enzyme
LQWRAEHPVSVQENTETENILQSLPILVVHAHSSCNCRCIMCDIWKTRESKSFRISDLVPHLSSIRRLGVRWVVFSGGEPLLNPDLPLLCSVLRAEGIRLTLLSTGILLQKCAAEVATSFDEVIVSLDGPPEIHNDIRRVKGAFEILQTGVQALRELRPDIRLTARSTVQKANHNHLRATARTAKLLRLDGISFLAVDLTSIAFNRSLAWPVSRQSEMSLTVPEIGVLEAEVESLILAAGEEFGPGFLAESPEKLRRIVRHFRAHLGLERQESPACNAPWVSAVIETDGTVRPCFFHPAIGNLSNDTLEDAINGAKARSFRTNLDIPSDSICRKCVCSLNYRT